MEDYLKRVWIAEAPPGVWSSGPTLIYDIWPETIQQYRDMGWTVRGPYVYQGEEE